MQADLPSIGIDAKDQFGPSFIPDTGDVFAFRGESDSWTIRLQSGESGSVTAFDLAEGSTFIINNRGNVYWIDPKARVVQLIESRYRAFETLRAPGGRILAFDFQDICCLDKGGLIWRRDDLMKDGIEVDNLTEGAVIVKGWQESPDDEVIVGLALQDGSLLKE